MPGRSVEAAAMQQTNWLLDLVEWCVREGREDATNWIAETRREGLTRDNLAERVVFQQAKLAARTPVTPAAVRSIPGVRAAIDGGLSPDVGFLVYRQVKSALYQAAAYKHDMKSRELPDRILLVLGLSFGEPRTRHAVVRDGRKPPGRIVAAIARNSGEYAQLLASTIETRFADQQGSSLIPQVGRPFLGAQNFLYISAAALAGRYLFNDLVISEDEMRDLDQRILDKSLSMLSLMVWMARADGHFDSTEQQVIESLKKSLMLPGVRPEDIEGPLADKPDWNRIRKAFQTEDEKACLLENILMVVWADGSKAPQEDRMCRRLSAELIADRLIDDIEASVRQQLGPSWEEEDDEGI